MYEPRTTARAGNTARRRRWMAATLLPLTLAAFGCANETSSPRTSGTSASTTAAPTAVAPNTSAPPERLDVVARDYDWSGIPDRLPPGSYPLTLRNAGSELHEIQVFRNTEKLSLAELFALGPVEMGAHVELAGGVLVTPGSTSDEKVLQLAEGSYEVVCFVPAAADQRPHFEHGMHRTITVG
jgi:hypothetical protein